MIYTSKANRNSGYDYLTVAPCDNCRKIDAKENMFTVFTEDFWLQTKFSCADCLEEVKAKVQREYEIHLRYEVLKRLGARP